MSIVLVSSDECLDHVAHPDHPEGPDRLRAVSRGVAAAGLGSDLESIEARPADRGAVLAIHAADQLGILERIDGLGGGDIDGDTGMNRASLRAAFLAAGSGLQAIAALERDTSAAALCAVRPPGHHATPSRSMGFCLLNNVAIAAHALTTGGSRVAIVDIDAHHGNGTQDAFYERDDVLFVSIHQSPLYPGTGRPSERGRGAGLGSTINLAVPALTSGDDYRRLIDQIVVGAVETFAPDWLLISAGFDGHRHDPLTQLALTSSDYADIVVRLQALVPAGRLVLFLEGGYDLRALENCVADVLVGLAGGDARSEPRSATSASGAVVDGLVQLFG